MPEVIVYSKEDCQPCRMVKRWLDKHEVKYTEEKADNHVDYLNELGYRQAPVTVTNGGHFYGFDIAQLQRLLATG